MTSDVTTSVATGARLSGVKVDDHGGDDGLCGDSQPGTPGPAAAAAAPGNRRRSLWGSDHAIRTTTCCLLNRLGEDQVKGNK